jgi:hypothetical protein
MILALQPPCQEYQQDRGENAKNHDPKLVKATARSDTEDSP